MRGWKRDGITVKRAVRDMKTLFLSVVVALIIGLNPTVSRAACSVTGTLVQLKFDDSGRKPTHTLYIREFKTDSFYYSATTTNTQLATAAASLVALQSRVMLTGSDSVCPSDNSTDRSIGEVDQIIVNP